MAKSLFVLLWVIAILFVTLLYFMNLYFGELNQDEGWYLYAARLVHEGNLPYIHFATTQGPVMSLVYSLTYPLVQKFGLAGGRFFTVLLGFSACLLYALLAACLYPSLRRYAAFFSFVLVAVNVYQNYYFTVVKTYSLTALFLALTFLFFVLAHKRNDKILFFLAGICNAIAGCTRSSAAFAVPAVVFYLIVCKSRKDIHNAFCFFLGFIICSAFLLIPFVLYNPSSLWFALWEYHTGRRILSHSSFWAYKAAFISRQLQAYFTAAAIFVLLVVMFFARLSFRQFEILKTWRLHIDISLWLAILFISSVHFMAPFPYDDYQVIVYPLFASALASAMCKMLVYMQGNEEEKAGELAKLFSIILLLITIMGSISSPINQEWFAAKRDRIWWPLKTETPLRKLQRVGALVKALTAPGDEILTQDPYVVVEADRRIPRGLELGQFSYFPDWSYEKASRCHVLNKEMFINLLSKAEFPMAVFSEYGFAIKSPGIIPMSEEESKIFWQLLEERYYLFREIPDFGQASTRLRVFLRKN